MIERVKNALSDKKTEYFLLILLIIYPLRHAASGLDLWDAGYNCGNFVNPGPGHMSEVWYFSTLLSTRLGHLFTLMPGGRTYTGLNIYTGLIVSAGVVLSYLFCTRRAGMDKPAAAVGLLLMMSLCYSPTPIVYNHLSNVLLTAAIVCIYSALIGDKAYLLAAAGFILGLNIFVRFSNLTQAALILAVWGYIFITGKKNENGMTGRYVRCTLLCVSGYLAAVLIMLVIINAKYGYMSYIDGIKGLFQMDGDAEYYTFSYMLKDMIISYLKGAHRAVYIAAFATAAYALQGIMRRVRGDGGAQADGDKKNRPAIIISLILSLALVAVLMLRGLLQFGFHHYAVVYNTAALLLDITMVFAVVTAVSSRALGKDRLLSFLVLLQIMITSVGSNTGISVAMNCMYLSAPYLVWRLAALSRTVFKGRQGKLMAPAIVVYCAVGAFMIQSILFGAVYVYQEGNNTGRRDARVMGNKVLQGVRMSGERAELLQDMTDYMNDNGLAGHETIVYGFVPAIAYYLDMPTAISSWPDLASYSYADMKADMERVSAEAENGSGDYPVVIIGHLLETSGIAENPRKTGLIHEFMDNNGYVKSHSNELFEIWRRGNEGEDQ